MTMRKVDLPPKPPDLTEDRPFVPAEAEAVVFELRGLRQELAEFIDKLNRFLALEGRVRALEIQEAKAQVRAAGKRGTP